MRLKVFRESVGELEENCYVLVDEDSKKCLVIDPGAEYEKIKKIIVDERATPVAVLLTHGHFDHVGAVEDFLKSGVKAYVFEEEKEILSNSDSNLSAYFDYVSVPKIDEVEYLQEKNYIFEPFNVEVIHTPGHTKGSVCYIVENKIFTGDTLFQNGHGRYDLPTGNLEDILSSLKKLKNLPDMTVYPGHGTFTTLDKERENGVLKNLEI